MDIKQIIDLHNQGYTQYEISKFTGYAQPTISIVLQSSGYSGKRKQRINEIKNIELKQFCIEKNITTKKLAQIMNCSINKSKLLLNDNKNVHFSVNQIKKLLNAMGKTFEEVFD